MDVALCEQLMNTPVPTTFFKRTFFAVYFYFDLLILLTHQDDQLTSFQKHEFFSLCLQTFCRNPRFRPSTGSTSTLLPHSTTLSNDVHQVRSHERWPLKNWELTETTWRISQTCNSLSKDLHTTPEFNAYLIQNVW